MPEQHARASTELLDEQDREEDEDEVDSVVPHPLVAYADADDWEGYWTAAIDGLVDKTNVGDVGWVLWYLEQLRCCRIKKKDGLNLKHSVLGTTPLEAASSLHSAESRLILRLLLESGAEAKANSSTGWANRTLRDWVKGEAKPCPLATDLLGQSPHEAEKWIRSHPEWLNDIAQEPPHLHLACDPQPDSRPTSPMGSPRRRPLFLEPTPDAATDEEDDRGGDVDLSIAALSDRSASPQDEPPLHSELVQDRGGVSIDVKDDERERSPWPEPMDFALREMVDFLVESVEQRDVAAVHKGLVWLKQCGWAAFVIQPHSTCAESFSGKRALTLAMSSDAPVDRFISQLLLLSHAVPRYDIAGGQEILDGYTEKSKQMWKAFKAGDRSGFEFAEELLEVDPENVDAWFERNPDFLDALTDFPAQVFIRGKRPRRRRKPQQDGQQQQAEEKSKPDPIEFDERGRAIGTEWIPPPKLPSASVIERAAKRRRASSSPSPSPDPPSSSTSPQPFDGVDFLRASRAQKDQDEGLSQPTKKRARPSLAHNAARKSAPQAIVVASTKQAMASGLAERSPRQGLGGTEESGPSYSSRPSCAAFPSVERDESEQAGPSDAEMWGADWLFEATEEGGEGGALQRADLFLNSLVLEYEQRRQ